MAKWRFFEKSKEPTLTSEVTEIKPLAEYKETLYAETHKSKHLTPSPSDQRIWRNVKSIEDNIDNIHVSSKPVTELDRNVDRLISKIKR